MNLRQFSRVSRGNVVLGIVSGFLMWALCDIITGQSEPVDAGLYLLVALLLSGVIASMPSPKQFLSGVAGIYIGQVVGMAFLGSSGSGANLWPLTAVMMVPLMGVSILGGLITCVVFSRVSSARQQTGDVSDAPEERE